jgi:putative Holliday junction resolvase
VTEPAATGGGVTGDEPRPTGATPFPRGRVLAVDWGERRVGLAVSDPLGIIASPAGAIVRRPGKRPPIAELVRRAEALEAAAFVLGLPLDGAGEDTPRAVEVRRIGEELTRRTGLPVRLVDERYTTAAALRAMREMGVSTRGRKETVDALAAAVLLRHALSLLANEAAAAQADASPPAPDAAPGEGAASSAA